MFNRAHENSLNLAGDGDELDLIEDIENAFDIRFDDNELENVLTVGDLHQTILRHMSGAVPAPRRHCRSATAFRRLRRAFKEATGEDVSPSTKVATLMTQDREGYVMREIQRRANLELDSVGLSSALVLACATAVTAATMSWIIVWPPDDSTGASAVTALALIVMGSLGAIVVADQTTGGLFARLNDRTITVGDLATRAVHLNFGKLTGRDKHDHPDDVWRTLLWLCRRMTSHNRLIDRETRIMG
jgi:hypothetical protein